MTSILPFEIKTAMKGLRAGEARPCSWKPEEQIKFAVFVDFFEEGYRICGERKQNWKFWRAMAVFIQSKNPNQCRIFHKKLFISHHSVSSILSFFRHNIKQYEYWKLHYYSNLCNTFQAFKREGDMIRRQSYLKQAKIHFEECPSLEQVLQAREYNKNEKDLLFKAGSFDSQEWKSCHSSFLEYLSVLKGITQQNHQTQ